MKLRFLLAAWLIPTLLFSQDKSDSTEIVNLLIADYKTMGNWDIKTHIANCTEDYMLIENGEIWNMQMEMEDYRRKSHRVIDRKDYFTFKHVRVFGNIAYAVYHLKSDIIENGKLTTKNWNESTIFRRPKDKWLIELIHSTPIDIKK